MGARFRRVFPLLLVILLIVPAAFAVRSPREQTSSHRRVRRARHIRWSTLLPGSHESLVRQNAEIDRLQLPRIEDDEELQELVQHEELVPIRTSEWVRIDPRLEPSRRYCRPWVRTFLEDMGQAYYKEFHQPIQVNSAVRTEEQQRKLRRTNHNAAPVEGETASSHLAGVTVDIARKGMSRKQRKWVVHYLLTMRDRGLIEAAEERRQSCFHVMVSERYTEWRGDQQLATRKPASQEKTEAGD